MLDTIFVPANAKLGIMLSGGADSSLLLWLLAKQNTPVTTFTMERKSGVLRNSVRIINWVNEYFNIKLPQPIKVGNLNEHHSMQVRTASREIFSRKLVSHLYFGVTQNPPVELPGNAPVRNPITSDKLIAPFWNYNKQDIVRLYRKYNIMDLFDLTQSCQIYTDRHCGECFHCQERAWGLNGI